MLELDSLDALDNDEDDSLLLELDELLELLLLEVDVD